MTKKRPKRYVSIFFAFFDILSNFQWQSPSPRHVTLSQPPPLQNKEVMAPSESMARTGREKGGDENDDDDRAWRHRSIRWCSTCEITSRRTLLLGKQLSWRIGVRVSFWRICRMRFGRFFFFLFFMRWIWIDWFFFTSQDSYEWYHWNDGVDAG